MIRHRSPPNRRPNNVAAAQLWIERTVGAWATERIQSKRTAAPSRASLRRGARPPMLLNALRLVLSNEEGLGPQGGQLLPSPQPVREGSCILRRDVPMIGSTENPCHELP